MDSDIERNWIILPPPSAKRVERCNAALKFMANEIDPKRTPPTCDDLREFSLSDIAGTDTFDEIAKRTNAISPMLGVIAETRITENGVERPILMILSSLSEDERHIYDLVPGAHAQWLKVKDELEDEPPHPLEPLVAFWLSRTKEARVDMGGGSGRKQVISAKMAMRDRDHDPRQRFSLPRLSDDQRIIPGMDAAVGIPALPLVLYCLGQRNANAPGPGAPLALRVIVECVCATPLSMRGDGPVALRARDGGPITAARLAKALWPNRVPRPTEYLPKLWEVADVLVSREALIPWEGGARHSVVMTNRPLKPNDEVRLVVDLPPGSDVGPQISENLRKYGPKNRRAYFALLNLPLWWHHPGRTLVPAKKGTHWLQAKDHKKYPKPTSEQLTQMVFPLTERNDTDGLLKEARETMRFLASEGEILWIDDTPLPPPRPNR